MRAFIESHSQHVFLKPGEAVVSRRPILVSTILGSCISVTMFSRVLGVGAICHAMFPKATANQKGLAYVEPALRHIHRKMVEYGAAETLEVKLFGGAAVLATLNQTSLPKSIGNQNLAAAKQVLEALGLAIARADIGGNRGRKLLFSLKTGDVYLRRLRPSDATLYWER